MPAGPGLDRLTVDRTWRRGGGRGARTARSTSTRPATTGTSWRLRGAEQGSAGVSEWFQRFTETSSSSSGSEVKYDRRPRRLVAHLLEGDPGARLGCSRWASGPPPGGGREKRRAHATRPGGGVGARPGGASPTHGTEPRRRPHGVRVGGLAQGAAGDLDHSEQCPQNRSSHPGQHPAGAGRDASGASGAAPAPRRRARPGVTSESSARAWVERVTSGRVGRGGEGGVVVGDRADVADS